MTVTISSFLPPPSLSHSSQHATFSLVQLHLVLQGREPLNHFIQAQGHRSDGPHLFRHSDGKGSPRRRIRSAFPRREVSALDHSGRASSNDFENTKTLKGAHASFRVARTFSAVARRQNFARHGKQCLYPSRIVRKQKPIRMLRVNWRERFNITHDTYGESRCTDGAGEAWRPRASPTTTRA